MGREGIARSVCGVKQWIARRANCPEVVGSSPTGSTKFGGVYRAAVVGAEVRIAWEPESSRASRASRASRRRIGPAQGR